MYTLSVVATIQKKVSRGRTYWQIVESRRVNGKPRPIVLEHLGSAEKLLQRLRESPARPAKAKVIQFGALAALWQIAQELDVVGLIDAQVPKRDQGLSCGQYLLLAALNRCVAAVSKASLYQWYRRTVLNRLLPTAQRSLCSQRFWDHMSMLDSAAIGAIEQQLAQRVIDRYRIDLRLLIFDATNFDTFIDSRTLSELAQRGHAKSKRADLRILGLALLVSCDYHIPLLSHPYPGNQNDAALFASLTEALISRCQQLAQECDDITLVFDGGNTSRENIEALQASPYHFITSLTVTWHEDLLAVPLSRFHSFDDPRLAGVTAYRTYKEIWGERRTVVVTNSRRLREGQLAGINHALRKKRAALRALRRKLAIELRECSRMAEELQQDRNRLTNRMREQLRRYYPQMLELGKGNNGKDIDAAWFLELWEKAPTPAEAARIRKASVAAILKRNRIRRHDAAGVLGILRQQPLEVGSGTIASATAHIESLIARLKLVNQQLKQAHTRLDELLAEILGDDDSGLEEEQRDVSVLRSLPGVGPIVLSTLLAEAPQALAERDYATLRTLTGVAPVTRRSGKSCVVIMRRACNKRLREAMYHWARVAIQHDPDSRARYDALRARGHRHARALRTVSDRLLSVACAMLRDRTPFDPQHRAARPITA